VNARECGGDRRGGRESPFPFQCSAPCSRARAPTRTPHAAFSSALLLSSHWTTKNLFLHFSLPFPRACTGSD
jgi:hypothetical protein